MSHFHDNSIDPHEFLASEEIGHEHVHVTPFWPMFWVFAILLVLTGLTVWSSNIHYIIIGNTTIPIGATPHIIIAMIIATVKAVLVGAYFMHLKYDKPVNTIVVASTLFGVVLFLGLTLADFSARGIHDARESGEIFPGGNMSLFSGTDERLENKRSSATRSEGSIVDQSVASGQAAAAHSPDNQSTPPAEQDTPTPEPQN